MLTPDRFLKWWCIPLILMLVLSCDEPASEHTQRPGNSSPGSHLSKPDSGDSTVVPHQGATREKQNVLVPVYYGTDRKVVEGEKAADLYSNEKDELQWGQCWVSIPKAHDMGEIERPSIWALEFSEDEDKHFVIKSVNPMTKEGFLRSLDVEGKKPGKDEALVFIHGYNVSFEDAAYRTAQMAYDMQFEGVPLLYSWPSHATLGGYLADGERIKWTIPHLKEFLTEVAQREGINRINIIAHSMGNRALSWAIVDIAREHPDIKFNNLILAAPDIDADIFVRDVAPFMVKTAECVTIYASSNDKALITSKNLNDGPRAGESGANLVMYDNIETVDASSADTDFLGHSYFASTSILLDDIQKVIKNGFSASERELETVTRDGRLYWELP